METKRIFSINDDRDLLDARQFLVKNQDFKVLTAGMRQCLPKCNIYGQARRPAPTKTCRGDSLWSPVSTPGSSQRYSTNHGGGG
jgi:hypothetical protein